ncbi:fatty acid--CoA ligase family protein [Thalassovita sp.]|uniref:class I adenylate-forming enzyme family protein n=1 Tax=Thalassovita sp. TaxID=1979401 RepID=UPI0029DE5FEE|nr:fatty acid--CoA ligase family protein [Thalassovita sp.]
MTDCTIFHVSEDSRLLTPLASGLSRLVDLLRAGQSFLARQSVGEPILGRSDQPQVFFCESSGSTGGAKTVRRRPESWIRSFDLNARCFGLGASDTYATFGNLGHSLTLFASLEALHQGADLLSLHGMLPKTQARQIAAARVSVLYATPTQLRLLVGGAQSAEVRELAAVRRVFAGGGKLDGQLRAQLAQLCPRAEIREFFGASETSFVTISEADTPEGSVGRAYPGVTIRIGDGAAAGQTGEIWVASPYLFDGYASGKAAETRRDGDFLSIGEMGCLDAAGNLFLRGRVSRMVTVADVNVFPEEIERAVMQMPEVSLCAVLALPDSSRGHRIACFIQARDDGGLAARIRQHCRKVLGASSVPRRIEFMSELPMLPAGKPDLQMLQRMLEAAQ